MSDALDIALACAAGGWHVFPICAGAKTPLTPNGFKDATTDPVIIAAWGAAHPGCNWAVACGASNLLVVDADPRNGADLAAVAAALPPTLSSATGGGGRHWFYSGARRVPKSVGPGIDLKSEGGYVLLPGSVTDETTRRDAAGAVHGTGVYEWADVVPIAPVPQVVLDALERAPTPRPDADSDLPAGLTLSAEWADLARAELSLLPAARKGDGGTPLLRAAAAAIRGWLLDLDTANDVLRAVWCTRCDPPWDFADAGDERNWWHTLERARDIGDVEWGDRRPLVGLDAAASAEAWRASTVVAVREDSTDPLQTSAAAPRRARAWDVYDGELAGAPANVERSMRRWRADRRGGGQSAPELRDNQSVLKWLVRVRGVDPMVIAAEFGQAYGEVAQSLAAVSVETIGILEQIDGVIRQAVNGGRLRFNDMMLRAELGGRSWSDDMTADIRKRCEKASVVPPDKTVKKTDIEERVQALAKQDSYHPVRDYLTALQWDGTARLDALFPWYFGAPNTPLNRSLSVCFALGAVRRVMTPGCKVDLMPILYGPQGVFKSTAIRELAGAAFFSDAVLNFGHRSENAMTLAGCWILEVPELEGMNRAEQNAVKAFTTMQVDRVLLPYARTKIERNRTSVMIGTTNDERPLRDPTGSRRYPVISAGAIAVDQLTRDRDQLWAEAVVRHLAGERHWLDSAMHAEAEQVNEEHTQTDESTETAIAAWLARPSDLRWLSHIKDHPKDGTFTVCDALVHGMNLPVDRHTRTLQTQAGLALRKLGLRGYGRIRVYRFDNRPRELWGVKTP